MPLSKSLAQHLSQHKTPFIRISEEKIKENIRFFTQTLQFEPHDLYYPIKVNPNPSIISTAKTLGLGFEVGAISECEALIEQGVAPSRIRYGNPVKSMESIVRAYQLGITCFGADSYQELDKLAAHAPNSSVYLRVAVDNSGAEWALTQKFGCPISQVPTLFEHGNQLDLNLFGISFHVGWNNEHLETWQHVFKQISELHLDLKQKGIPISSINIGGGFPAHLGAQYEDLAKISAVISPMLNRFRNEDQMEVVAEPGSFLVANSGTLFVRVIERINRNGVDWIYVDSGIFQGFAWIMGGLKYQVEAFENSSECKPMVVCGPTCDTHDVFSHQAMLPQNIGVGDLITVTPAGAYIASSANYNGFAYPKEIIIDED